MGSSSRRRASAHFSRTLACSANSSLTTPLRPGRYSGTGTVSSTSTGALTAPGGAGVAVAARLDAPNREAYRIDDFAKYDFVSSSWLRATPCLCCCSATNRRQWWNIDRDIHSRRCSAARNLLALFWHTSRRQVGLASTGFPHPHLPEPQGCDPGPQRCQSPSCGTVNHYQASYSAVAHLDLVLQSVLPVPTAVVA